MKITNAQKEQAKKINLYEYLVDNHYDDIKIEGNSLRLRNNKSICVKRGANWYHDFSTEKTGDTIELLMKEFGYTFPDAVISLCDGGLITTAAATRTTTKETGASKIDIPRAKDSKYRNLYAYLCGRGITADLITRLITEGILYQEAEYNNIVFINIEKDFCELHGSLSYGKSFHQCRKSQPDRFWSFNTDKRTPEEIYICEASIDAMSLYLIHQRNGKTTPCAYVSIGGVANQQTIERIKKNVPVPVIIAVDNDNAGQLCREKNLDLKSIIPKNKDWNEDLMKMNNLK